MSQYADVAGSVSCADSRGRGRNGGVVLVAASAVPPPLAGVDRHGLRRRLLLRVCVGGHRGSRLAGDCRAGAARGGGRAAVAAVSEGPERVVAAVSACSVSLL